MDFNHVASTYMGIGRGGSLSPPWILKILAKKVLSFEWEKTNFATFGHP